MWILGLTGAIGAGKSTLAKYLEKEGVPVHSSDSEIHSLLKTDLEVQQKVRTLWPDVFIRGRIDRNLLGERVLSSPSSLSQLEDILYPSLAHRQKLFLDKNKILNYQFVVLEVPLLFEVGLDRYCDYVILASTPLYLRKLRVLKRKGMTLKKFKAFESHQMKESERKKRADFIIPCGREKGSALKRIREILKGLSQKPSPPWQGKWPTTFKRKIHDTGSRSRH